MKKFSVDDLMEFDLKMVEEYMNEVWNWDHYNDSVDKLFSELREVMKEIETSQDIDKREWLFQRKGLLGGGC